MPFDPALRLNELRTDLSFEGCCIVACSIQPAALSWAFWPNVLMMTWPFRFTDAAALTT
jgi:hypothetical protein